MKQSRLLISAIIITGLILVVGALIIVNQTDDDSDGESETSLGADLLANASDSDDECIVCHVNHTPGIIAQFGDSAHFGANVSCANCHEVPEDTGGATQHPDQDFYVLARSSAGRCATCHENQVDQYNHSRHGLPSYVAYAGTDGLSEDHLAMYEEISEGGFLDGGRARNAIHALEGPAVTRFACESCHNVGKPNEDGSVGDCTACHLRHEFSLEQVRKPETCNACHIGPDHPQWEIYHESPHGIAYTTGGDDWNWEAEPGTLTTTDFPAPTCATCHFSGFGSSGTTHDVGERLTWYLFAPVSERRPTYQENASRMQGVCQACHSSNFIDEFYSDGDEIVEAVNDWVYFSRAMIAPLNANELLTSAPFDEPIDYTFFNVWHHWGRTAKFGAWMQGPDYTQWHGAYEIMHDLSELREQVDEKLSEVGLCLDMPEGFPSNETATNFIAQFDDVSQASIPVTDECGEASVESGDEDTTNAEDTTSSDDSEVSDESVDNEESTDSANEDSETENSDTDGES